MADDLVFMGLALGEAKKALRKMEVPIGAVLVMNNDVVSRGYNRVESCNDPTAHAEMIAIKGGAKALGRWRLTDTTLYTTVEPCCMCLGAIILARISRLVYAINEPKMGFCSSQAHVLQTVFKGYNLVVNSGVLANEARDLMQDFFKKIRRGTEVWP